MADIFHYSSSVKTCFELYLHKRLNVRKKETERKRLKGVRQWRRTNK